MHRAHQLRLCESLIDCEHFLVGDEAVEDGLDAHAEDLKEHRGHPEGQQEAQKDRSDDTADLVVVQCVDDGQVAAERRGGGDEDLM